MLKREICASISRPAMRRILRAPRSSISLTQRRPGCVNCSIHRRFGPFCRQSFSRGMRRRIGSRRSRGLSWLKAIHGSAPAYSCFSSRSSPRKLPRTPGRLLEDFQQAAGRSRIFARRVEPRHMIRDPNSPAPGQTGSPSTVRSPRPSLGKRGSTNLGSHGSGVDVRFRPCRGSAWNGRPGSEFCLCGAPEEGLAALECSGRARRAARCGNCGKRLVWCRSRPSRPNVAGGPACLWG